MSTALRMGVNIITSIIMRVNTITNIIRATATTPNHIIMRANTQNITGITRMSTSATERSPRPIRYNLLIDRIGGVPLCGYAPIVSLGHDGEPSSFMKGWLREEKPVILFVKPRSRPRADAVCHRT
jgi:hypothetical protein